MSNTIYTDAMRAKGLADAADLQERSGSMDGTALYAEEEKIPDFQAAKAVKNMLERPVGFVCRSTAGRVVKLLQVYDSDIYTQEPEELPAQWGFKWSTDPAKALPFIALSTSPYGKGECCTESDKIYRSAIDNNKGGRKSASMMGLLNQTPKNQAAARWLIRSQSQHRNRKNLQPKHTRTSCSQRVDTMRIAPGTA